MNRLILFCAAISLTAGAVNAQTVSLDSCRNMAIRNNKNIRIAEQNIKAAGYEKKAAFSTYLPGLDFTGGYMYNQQQIELLSEDAKLPTMSFDPATQKFNYNILTAPDGIPIRDPASGSLIPTEVAVIPKEAMEFDTHNVWGGAFTLTQPIYMGGQIRALNKITQYAEKLAVAARNSAVQDVVFAVDEAYWLVISLKEKKRLADSFVNLVDTLRYNVKEMLDAGVATRSDLLTVEVKLNEAQIAQTKVENGLTLSRMALAQVCGLPVDTPMELEDESLQGAGCAPAAPVSYDMNEVYSRRQDLDMVRHGISILEQREKVALGEMLPKVALVGAYSFTYPNVNHGFNKAYGGGFSVGATLIVPLWHWGGRYNHYRATKINTQASRLALEDLEEKIDLQVNQARFSYEEARKTYDMTARNLEKADENLRQAQLAFHEGVLTADDVIGAQTAWLQANSEKIDAQIGIRLCEVYLSKVLGTMPY